MQSELQPLVNKKRSLVDEPSASVFLSLSSLSLSFSLHSPSSHLFCFLSFFARREIADDSAVVRVAVMVMCNLVFTTFDLKRPREVQLSSTRA